MSKKPNHFTNPQAQKLSNKFINFCSKGEVSHLKKYKEEFEIFSTKEKTLVYQSGFNHACLCDKVNILDYIFFEPDSPIYKDMTTFFVGLKYTFENHSLKAMEHLLKRLLEQWEEDNSPVPEYCSNLSGLFITLLSSSETSEDFIWLDKQLSYMDKIRVRHTSFALAPVETLVQQALLFCFLKNSSSVAQFLIHKYHITGEEASYQGILEQFRSKSQYQDIFQTMKIYKDKQNLEKNLSSCQDSPQEDTHYPIKTYKI